MWIYIVLIYSTINPLVRNLRASVIITNISNYIACKTGMNVNNF